MTPSRKSYSQQLAEAADEHSRRRLLLQKGTRRQHTTTGEVYRVRSITPAGLVRAISESTKTERVFAPDYWLGDTWRSPSSRAGARKS